MLISQEEIFHICGEEVNLYLAGVNRFELEWIGVNRWHIADVIQSSALLNTFLNFLNPVKCCWPATMTRLKRNAIKKFRRLSSAEAYRAEDNEDGPVYWTLLPENHDLSQTELVWGGTMVCLKLNSSGKNHNLSETNFTNWTDDRTDEFVCSWINWCRNSFGKDPFKNKERKSLLK